MAALIELEQWEAEVYQLETNDPVLGGENGIDNLQAKQLANRTQYLKAALELKALLNSPEFTGNPKAPTPAFGDNDTSIATTAFVQAALAALSNTGDYKDSVRVATTAPINLAAPGANIDGVAMVAGNRFLDKDHATTALRGIYIWNGAAVPATRATDADDGAELNGGAIIPVEEGTINKDTNWQLTTNGVVVIGSTALTFERFGNFKKNYSANDYHIFDSGLIVQWGATTTPSNNVAVAVTLPIAWPTGFLQAVAGAANLAANADIFGIAAAGVGLLTQINITQNGSVSQGTRWIAIGY